MKKGTVQQMRAMKIGEQMVIPWSDLPQPRPQDEGYMGFKHYIFHCVPKEGGLHVSRIEKAPEDVMAKAQHFVVGDTKPKPWQ